MAVTPAPLAGGHFSQALLTSRGTAAYGWRHKLSLLVLPAVQSLKGGETDLLHWNKLAIHTEKKEL